MDPLTAKRAVKLAREAALPGGAEPDDQPIRMPSSRRICAGQIREQSAARGADDGMVSDMVTRYGDFVLYQPPFKRPRLLLWIGPRLCLVAGFFVLFRSVPPPADR